jgi:NitT/TauT family transport system permease protein
MRRLPAVAAALMLLGLVLPAGRDAGGESVSWFADPLALAAGLAALLLAAAVATPFGRRLPAGPASLAALGFAAVPPLLLVHAHPASGLAAPGLWLFLAGAALVAWRAMEWLAAFGRPKDPMRLAAPALFGLWLVYLWEVAVIGFGVPQILLPAPHQIAHQLFAQAPILADDFRQTFLKAVLAGWLAGSGLGLLVAIAIDRVPFLQRGLLPLGNLVSAVPIVGIAPIMVMWFGFDWQSKAAVIVVMTFFPMLINALAGLNQVDAMDRDLMRSYGAGYWQGFFKLRLPSALPFVFNALKINSTLALIGAIVAEFFGSPIAGMGFRISVEVARMNVDMVWATIAVAALAGSLFYGALALLERELTFWHPSYRT